MTGCLPCLPGVRGCGLCLVERDREHVSAVTTLTEDGFGLTDPGHSLRNGDRETVGRQRIRTMNQPAESCNMDWERQKALLLLRANLC